MPRVLALAGVAAVGVLARVDPAGTDWLPRCPTHVVTGLDCPGCGSLRAVHSLLTGDVVGAAGHNLLLLVALVWLAVVAGRTLVGRPPFGPRAARTWLVAVVAFTVVRNVPGMPFLPAA